MMKRAFAWMLAGLLSLSRAGSAQLPSAEQFLERVTSRPQQLSAYSARGITDVWNEIVLRYGVPVVLMVSERDEGTSCVLEGGGEQTLDQAIQQVLNCYPNFKTTVDPATNVCWIHPADLEPNQAFDNYIVIPDDELGVPLLSGVLLPILEETSLFALYPRLMSTFPFSAANQGVDLAAGKYNLFTLLNQLCAQNPFYTYRVTISQARLPLLEVLHLSRSSDEKLRAGDKVFASLYLGEPSPGMEHLRNALASTDSTTVWAARTYLELASFHPIRFVQDAENLTNATAAAVAISQRLAPTTFSGTPKEMKEVLKRGATSDAVPTHVRALAALELMRIADLPDSAITSLRQTTLPAHEVRAIAPQVVYSLRGKPTNPHDLETSITHGYVQRLERYEHVRRDLLSGPLPDWLRENTHTKRHLRPDNPRRTVTIRSEKASVEP